MEAQEAAMVKLENWACASLPYSSSPCPHTPMVPHSQGMVSVRREGRVGEGNWD